MLLPFLSQIEHRLVIWILLFSNFLLDALETGIDLKGCPRILPFLIVKSELRHFSKKKLQTTFYFISINIYLEKFSNKFQVPLELQHHLKFPISSVKVGYFSIPLPWPCTRLNPVCVI